MLYGLFLCVFVYACVCYVLEYRVLFSGACVCMCVFVCACVWFDVDLSVCMRVFYLWLIVRCFTACLFVFFCVCVFVHVC